MMEVLARRGFAVEVLCGSVLEINSEIDLPSALIARGLAVGFRGGEACEADAFGPLGASRFICSST